MGFIERLLIIAIVLVAANQGCATVTQSKAGTATTIILTRHADRDILGEDLNDKGRERAKALVKAVEGMNITAIYSPNKSRNINTAKPLAEYLGIEITIVDKRPDVNKLIKTFLTKYAGETVLWVGNTDNLKYIYSVLGGEGDAPVDYGDLYIMTIKDTGKPDVVKKSYGSM